MKRSTLSPEFLMEKSCLLNSSRNNAAQTHENKNCITALIYLCEKENYSER